MVIYLLVVAEEFPEPTEKEFYHWHSEFRQFRGPSTKSAVCAIDGTTTNVQVPWSKSKRNVRKSYWNAKYHEWAITTLLLVLLNGIIIAFSPPKAPNCDQAHWKESHWRKWFENKPYGPLGDSGFTFNPAYEPTLIHGHTTKKKKQGEKTVSDADAKYSQEISKARSVVENTNAQLKKWGVFCRFPFQVSLADKNGKRHNAFDITIVLSVLIMLTNRKLKKSPLRKPFHMHSFYDAHKQPL